MLKNVLTANQPEIFFFLCKDRMMGPRPLINYNLVSLAFQHVRAISYLKVYDCFPQLLASRDLSARFLQMLYNAVSHHFLSLSCPKVLRFHCGCVRRLLWGTMAHRPLETCSHCGKCEPFISLNCSPRSLAMPVCYALEVQN